MAINKHTCVKYNRNKTGPYIYEWCPGDSVSDDTVTSAKGKVPIRHPDPPSPPPCNPSISPAFGTCNNIEDWLQTYVYLLSLNNCVINRLAYVECDYVTD